MAVLGNLEQKIICRPTMVGDIYFALNSHFAPLPSTARIGPHNIYLIFYNLKLVSFKVIILIIYLVSHYFQVKLKDLLCNFIIF